MIGRLGIAYQLDPDAGLALFAPKSGLFFMVHPAIVGEALAWLQGRENALDSKVAAVLESAQTPSDLGLAIAHGSLLPDDGFWDNPPTLSRPLVFNWFLTGCCQLDCQYCYAQDLMHGVVPEPSAAVVEAIAEGLLRRNPLVVVLTGGDPLLSPHLRSAVELLAPHCAVVVDTNGILLTSDHIEHFLKHKVMVRISLDGETPKLGRLQRPAGDGFDSAPRAFQAICEALDAGLPVAVHSVATKAGLPNLHWFGDKLHRLGVVMWRVFRVSPSRDRMSGYHSAIGGSSSRSELAFEKTWAHFVSSTLPIRAKRWSRSMAVQVAGNELRHSVVLIAPNGAYYTESSTRNEKLLIDEDNPGDPSLDRLVHRIELGGHSRRYFSSGVRLDRRQDRGAT